MTDIDKKLKKMEEQLDVITSSLQIPDSRYPPHSKSEPRFLSEAHPDSRFSAAGRSDEIDLRELFSILWEGKWWIIGITFLFAVAGVTYALSLPNMYKSEGIYAPASKDASGAIPEQYGGLAALAGIQVGGGSTNNVDQAIVLVRSWSFLASFINKYDLKPLIMGVKRWDVEKNEIVWDERIYDFSKKEWVENSNGKSLEPSSFEVYKVLSRMLSVSKDTKTGLIYIGIEYCVPELSARWVNLIVEEINDHFKSRDKMSAINNIEYLNQKIGDTSIAEMQAVFYSMIEAQTRTLMLAEVSSEYLIETVVPVKVQEQASSPNRLLILIIIAILGSVLSTVLLIFIQFCKGRI